MQEMREAGRNFIRQIIDNDLATGQCSSIHTRFPPEPNGYLHLGHAKAVCLNFTIAQDYGGKCNLRFDDTDPQKEELRYVEAIQEDIRWLGFQWDGTIRHSSDYFPQMYRSAVDLINRGLAYVDELSVEEIRAYRGTLTEAGKNSPYRDRPVGENLALFEQMRQGKLAEGSASLRARIDMASPFMVLRDPVLYRIKFVPHHQTGKEWCIYPMYDFAHPICDAIEGITHSLCTLEFQDNRRFYDWLLSSLAVAHSPRQYEFSRLNLAYTILSKRKLTQLVSEKIVSGWDDPRMPTISGMRRRGYPAEAIRNFCQCIGVTKQENRIEVELLESCVREVLNHQAPRAMAVLNPLKVVIENFPSDQIEQLSIDNHPNRPELGKRQLHFGSEIYIDRSDFREEANRQYKRLILGGAVRLRYGYVITAQRVERDHNGEIQTVYCSYDPETLGRDPKEGKVRGVIHWVAVATALEAEFHLYERLFKVANPEAVEPLTAAINPDSLQVLYGFVEPSLAAARLEEPYQFEREGYFCLAERNAEATLIFNRSVALRDSWGK